MSEEVTAKDEERDRGAVSIAATQMDANPAPTAERLARAEKVVAAAVEAGAQLVVLPECFNTGYTFSEENHGRVETVGGPTVKWMAEVAARLNIHLAGSLMLLDGEDVYNALILHAPDGRMWRYDKNYPWGYERGYFRGPRQKPKITIAETDLGAIGMMVCWDVAHLDLWRSYAACVDLIVIASCPADVGHATYHLANGDQYTAADLGSQADAMADTVTLAFGEMMDQQTAWLGVPAVHSIGFGHIRTDIPMGRRSLMAFALAAPSLLKYLPQANDMQMACDCVSECKIVDGTGEVVARLSEEDGETFALAEVHLRESGPASLSAQPTSPVPRMSYFFVDSLLPRIVRPVYRKGQRRWRHSA